MKSFSLRYALLTYRLDQLWLPGALWSVCAIMTLFFRNAEPLSDVVRGFGGGILPLLGGIMAAYAVLDDPALELRFATPIPAWRILVERLGMTFSILIIAALSFQLFVIGIGIDLRQFGDPVTFQVAWLLPCIALVALGCVAAFAFGNSMGGALLVGLVWLLQLAGYGWFIAHPTARYIMVFMTLLRPEHPDLLANQICLLTLSTLFLVCAWMLLKKQERYI